MCEGGLDELLERAGRCGVRASPGAFAGTGSVREPRKRARVERVYFILFKL
jgi:hypothetical protein